MWADIILPTVLQKKGRPLHIDNNVRALTGPWFSALKTSENPRGRFICFPFAGGSPVSFAAWRELLPEGVDLIVAQLPGRGTRLGQAPQDNLHRLADEIAAAITPLVIPDTLFYGHSMGAALAYEVALRIESRTPIKHLFCGAFRAPHLDLSREPIYALPDGDFIDRLRGYQGTPDGVLDNAELMELLMPMLRADFKAVETYKRLHCAPLDVPITLFHGDADPYMDLEQIRPWALYTRGGFNFHTLAGDHFFLGPRAPFIIRTMLAGMKG